MTHIVHWSGGADSTLVLTHVADTHGRALALTVKHPQLEADQAQKEHEARQQYKAWAKRRGIKFDHRIIDIRTKAHAHDGGGQAGLWLAATSSYVRPDDSVYHGYIRGDDFWHTRFWHDEAFRALMVHNGCGATVKLCYPLEWHRKVDVLRNLRAWRMPQRCWWTCDCPTTNGRACGRCLKCVSLRRAKEDLVTLRTEKMKVQVGGDSVKALMALAEEMEDGEDREP